MREVLGMKWTVANAVRPTALPSHSSLRYNVLGHMIPSPADLPSIPNARHLGDLARGGTSWSVFLEAKTDSPPVKGRVHFVSNGEQRSTGWIFLEWTEQDLLKRFQEFSAVELWKLLESLA